MSNTKQEINKQQFSILIVDDDKNIAQTFGEILETRGHTVTVTHESMACISKCQNYQYDIIFMDFHLGEINGVDVIDLLKTVCNNHSLVIAVSGDDSKESLEKYKNVGMDGAIIKPLDIDIIDKFMNSLETRNSIDKRVIKTMGNLKHKKQLYVF